MNKLLFLLVGSALLPLVDAQAQENRPPTPQHPSVPTLLTTEERELQLHTLTWGASANAAGLGLEAYQQHGAAGFTTEAERGTLHRRQEGNGRNSLRFNADRYDRINNRFRVWGAFNFDMNRELERAYSDVFDTYNRSPYIFGSNRPANYDTQLFDFAAKVAYLHNERFTFGLGINYLVGDMSRLRDPRSRSHLADYTVMPAVTLRLNAQHSVGLYANYRYRKEKMPGVKTYQETPDFKYYFMMGLDNGEEPRLNADLESGMGMTRGWVGFRRQFMSNFWGGGLQYQLARNGWRWFSQLEYQSEAQHIWGDNQRSPGEYLSTKLNIASTLKSPSRTLHGTLRLSGELYKGQSNEFIQRLIETTNPQTGISSKKWVTEYVYHNQYQVATGNLGVNGQLLRMPSSGKGYLWKAGFTATTDWNMNQYNLPFSQLNYSFASGELYGGARLLSRANHSLTLNAQSGVRIPLSNSLQLNAPQNDLAQLILTPDMEYYQSTVASVGANMTYNFPIQRGNKRAFGAFVKLYASNSWTLTHSRNEWLRLGVSVGIITL